jgi:hypothetical protein
MKWDGHYWGDGTCMKNFSQRSLERYRRRWGEIILKWILDK